MSVSDSPSEPSPPSDAESWEFAGWGTAERVAQVDLDGVKVSHLNQPEKRLLGTWASTAICGNDITSSCLYVAAICAIHAGPLAPIALGLVAVVLYLFRKVYAEVGSALPLNGGTYTVLLNTTNKKLAAGAAVLTLLSYVATAVISAGEAMHYANGLWHGLPVFWATLGLLGLFAFLNLVGISESAIVALVIFVLHILTLTVLVVVGGFAVIRDPSLFAQNWHMPTGGGMLRALFFGFAAAMLGVSGFESSANFIEEQQEGVFPKTLRNMWIAVAIFNPIISVLSLGLIPLADMSVHKDRLLAHMGDVSFGTTLGTWVSIDAVLVLSGAVLTSYVGVIGLMRRMSLDRCLPKRLLSENRWRHTNHWIIVAFFLICCSIAFTTRDPNKGVDVGLLAGVYTLSFLSVMALFAIGNMLLKVKRDRLPRATRAPWSTVIIAFIAVVLGLVGNVLIDPAYVEVFGAYFVAAAAIVAIMFLRLEFMKLALFVSRSVVQRVQSMNQWVRDRVVSKIEEINSLSVVYFTKGSDPAELNRAALYVLENEQTSHLRVVHAYKDGEGIPPELAQHLSTIDKLYPRLRIDFIAVKAGFGPELIEWVSQRYAVPKNYMFIGTPGDRFPHRINDLGGVRLIL